MIDKKDLPKVKNLIEILNQAKFEDIKMTDIVLLTRSIEWLGKEYMESSKPQEVKPVENTAEQKMLEDIGKAKLKAEENAAKRKSKKADK